MQANVTLAPHAAAFAARQVAQECEKELSLFGCDAANLTNLTCKRMTYTDAGKLHSGAGIGMARVAQFILGQKDIRDCVPFLINRKNVI